MDAQQKVMIVDDDDMTQVLISNILGDGYQTFSAATGSDCLQRMPEIRPDIVLLDVNMPVMDGLDVCRQIRSDEQFRNVAVLFISSSDTKDEIIAGYEAGADDYLVKPLHHDTLLAKMAHCSDLIKQRREAVLLNSGPQTEEARFTQPYSRFVHELKSCHTLGAAAEKLFSYTRRANLSCRMQICRDGQFHYFADDGLLQPIETNLLEQMRSQGPVYRFGKRVILNFDHVSLLIRNMPMSENEHYSQLLDFLIHLLGTTDVYVDQLTNRLSRNEIQNTLHSAVETLQFIHQEFSQHSAKVNGVLDGVALEFSRNIDKLHLTDEQEDYMINLIDNHLRKLMELNNQALQIEENMQDFIENLSQKFQSE